MDRQSTSCLLRCPDRERGGGGGERGGREERAVPPVSTVPQYTGLCSDGTIRLVGSGRDNTRGRLEVCLK